MAGQTPAGSYFHRSAGIWIRKALARDFGGMAELHRALFEGTFQPGTLRGAGGFQHSTAEIRRAIVRGLA